MATDLNTKVVIDASTKGGESIVQLGEGIRKLTQEAGQAAPDVDSLRGGMQQLVQQAAAVQVFERAASRLATVTDELEKLASKTAEAKCALAAGNPARRAGKYRQTNGFADIR